MKLVKLCQQRVLFLVLVLISQVIYCENTFAEMVTINRPTIDGYRVDWCRDWGKNCGWLAAHKYCQKIGHKKAKKIKMAPDIGSRTPTKVISSGQICNSKGCDGFKYVKCEIKGAALASPNKFMPKKDKKNSKAAMYDDPGKADSAVGHYLPTNTFNSYQSLADSAIKAIAGSHQMNSNKLIRDIESKCGTKSDACYLDKKLTFIRNYLSQ